MRRMNMSLTDSFVTESTMIRNILPPNLMDLLHACSYVGFDSNDDRFKITRHIPRNKRVSCYQHTKQPLPKTLVKTLQWVTVKIPIQLMILKEENNLNAHTHTHQEKENCESVDHFTQTDLLPIQQPLLVDSGYAYHLTTDQITQLLSQTATQVALHLKTFPGQIWIE